MELLIFGLIAGFVVLIIYKTKTNSALATTEGVIASLENEKKGKYMIKDAFKDYLDKAIEEEKSFTKTIKILATVSIALAVISILAGLILMFNEQAIFGISLIAATLCTYIGTKFLTSAAKILINIQAANTLMLINTANFDTSDSLKSIKEMNDSTSQSENSDNKNRNVSDILAEERDAKNTEK